MAVRRSRDGMRITRCLVWYRFIAAKENPITLRTRAARLLHIALDFSSATWFARLSGSIALPLGRDFAAHKDRR